MKIGVVGTGYVGLVTGVVLAEVGHDVICVDHDLCKVESIKKGIPPIFEPGLDKVLKEVLASGRFHMTNSVAEATQVSEVVFIAVGTPPGEDGTPDLTQVRAVAHEIGKSINHYVVVVNKSTVPVGTGELVENIITSYGVPATLFDVVSNPEFLREGTALEDTRKPDRLVIGAEKPEAAEVIKRVFEKLPCPTLVTTRKSAELVKYASNSYLALKISFINAISRVCELSGAKVSEVAAGVGMDARIGPQFLQAGLGWGGSCLPKDVQGLIQVAKNWGYDFELMKDVVAINKDQTSQFMKRLEHRLGGFKGKKIGILGLAFKPNTDDLRDAKSLIMIEELLAKGAEVCAYDPVAQKGVEKLFPKAKYAKTAYEVAKDAEAVMLVTEWREFKELDLPKLASGMKQKILFDGRLAFKREAVEAAGLEYHVVGERSAVTTPG